MKGEKKSRQSNASLGKARAAKNDEFYTRWESIEEEVWNYREHFRGAVVYCNCDDPKISEFYRYFKLNFGEFGLRRLITTCYKNRNPDMFTRYDSETAVSVEYDGVETHLHYLQSDGDFRNPECIDLLRQADIVCTNPPFSLFRDYVAQLVAEKKKFLIIGNYNAVSYREIFRLIMAGKLWLGFKHRTMEFDSPDGSVFKFRNVFWFTNMDHAARHEKLILTERYNESAYPKYDNYDAINVNRTVDIPRDYAGVMGVPISFLEKYNPEQFEIIGQMANTKIDEFNYGYPYIDGKRKYARILIRNKNPE